jgi:ADP-ribose pyrophosphatase YjhB (NUDIX family)
MPSQWLLRARKLQALAQSGLLYSTNPFEIDRYRQIHDIACEIMASLSGQDLDSVKAIFSGEKGYATPKVDVRGFVFRGGAGEEAVLLVKEKADGLWSLPGGWADVNDSPSEAVVREIGEESGYRARAVKLLALYDRNRHGHTPHPFHIYKLFFLCELAGGSPAGSSETEDVGFFELDRLPPLSTGRVTEAQIRRLAQLARDPHSMTDFD